VLGQHCWLVRFVSAVRSILQQGIRTIRTSHKHVTASLLHLLRNTAFVGKGNVHCEPTIASHGNYIVAAVLSDGVATCACLVVIGHVAVMGVYLITNKR
jgi:hypothetical protein